MSKSRDVKLTISGLPYKCNYRLTIKILVDSTVGRCNVRVHTSVQRYNNCIHDASHCMEVNQ